MDGRVPQPSDRRVVSRQEPAYRPAEEPQPVSHYAASQPASPRSRSRRKADRQDDDKPSKKGILWTIAIVATVIALGVAGWLVVSSVQKTATGIDANKYQAVFFTNGQVYFGKLQTFNDEAMKMTDIYYLQTEAAANSENPQSTSNEQSNVQLIKLGDEIHGPEDSMILYKEQVLLYENLKDDSKVVQSIKQHKQQNP